MDHADQIWGISKHTDNFMRRKVGAVGEDLRWAVYLKGFFILLSGDVFQILFYFSEFSKTHICNENIGHRKPKKKHFWNLKILTGVPSCQDFVQSKQCGVITACETIFAINLLVSISGIMLWDLRIIRCKLVTKLYSVTTNDNNSSWETNEHHTWKVNCLVGIKIHSLGLC